MAEEYLVEWPVVQDPDERYRRVPLRPGHWIPVMVLLEEIRDAWGHRIYRESSLARDITRPAQRPRKGFVIFDPWTNAELGLIVRLQKDPPGPMAVVRQYYNCHYVNDYFPGRATTDGLCESRRWAGIRTDGIVLHATATRAEAIRHTLQPLRVWEDPPVEGDPEGEDLDALAGL